MSAEKENIRLKSVDELKEVMESLGEKPFRGKQLHEWLWKKKAESFSEMTNLSKPLISKLEEAYFIPVLGVHNCQVSSDGTIKSGFKLDDGLLVVLDVSRLLNYGSATTAA